MSEEKAESYVIAVPSGVAMGLTPDNRFGWTRGQAEIKAQEANENRFGGRNDWVVVREEIYLEEAPVMGRRRERV